MKKQILCCMVIAAMSITALIGCGSGDSSSTNKTEETTVGTETVEETTKEEVKSGPVDLEIADSVYSIDNGYIHYAVCIENPNPDYRPSFAHIQVTGKTADDTIRFHDDWTISGMGPESTTYWVNQAGNGEVAEDDKIEISVTVNKSDWESSKQIIPEDLYTFDSVSVSEGDMGWLRATGEITLTDDSYDLGYNGPYKPMVVCILKDESGKLVGGFNGYIDSDLTVGEKSVFEISSYFKIGEYATAEVYANPWL